MTISSQTNKNTYLANSIQTVYPYTFKILADEDIIVESKNLASGITTVITTGFVVDGIDDEAGGNITFTIAPATGVKIVLRRDMELLQETHYEEYSTLPAKDLETNLDAVVMMIQQLQEEISRCLKVDSGSLLDTELGDPTDSAGFVIRVNEAEDGFEYGAGSSGGGTSYTFPVGAAGILAQTATGNATGRTITGTANQVTVTNGSGVSGNPTISLPTAMDLTGFTITNGTFTGGTYGSGGGGSGPPFDHVNISVNRIFNTTTNEDIKFEANGTGKVYLGQTNTGGVVLAADQALLDSNLNELLKFSKVASAVNELTVYNAATANPPGIGATGGTANNGFNLYDSNANAIIKLVCGGASASNSLTFANATSGNSPYIQVNNNATGPNLLIKLGSAGVLDVSTATGSSGAAVRLREATGNGTNYIGLKAPDSISADKTWVLPESDGVNYLMKSDGSGNLSLVDPSTVVSAGSVNAALFQARLSLNSSFSLADVSAASTLYLIPFKGTKVATYDSSVWTEHTLSSINITSGSFTSNKPHDIWVYWNSSTLALECTAWTNDTTRATALTTQDGVYVKTGTTSRRYVGTVYFDTGFNDSTRIRWVWNYYNRLPRQMIKSAASTSWTYTTATYRQVTASAAYQFDVVVGVAEDKIDIDTKVSVLSSVTASVWSGIGVDSTSVNSATQFTGWTANTTYYMTPTSRYIADTVIGKHYYAWLEKSTATGTTTWYGTQDAAANVISSGMNGTFYC